MPLRKLQRLRNVRQNSLSSSEMTESSSPTTSTRSSQSSNGTLSTNVSSLSSFDHCHDARNNSLYGSCYFDAEDYFTQLREDVNVSDDCPSKKTLEEAGEIVIYDSQGIGKPFKSFFQGDMAIGQRQLVLFVRHFYCGVRAYSAISTDTISNTHDRPAKPTSRP